MTLEEFEQYAALGFNCIPVYHEVDFKHSHEHLLTLLTKPYRAFYQFHDAKGQLISVIGITPLERVTLKDRIITIMEEESVIKTFSIDDILYTNPFDWLNDYIHSLHTPFIEELPSFHNGFLGYMSFEMAQFSNAPFASTVKPCPYPDFYWIRYNDFLIINEATKQSFLVTHIDPVTCKDSYEEATVHLFMLAENLNDELKNTSSNKRASLLQWPANIAFNDFEEKINKLLPLLEQNALTFLSYYQYLTFPNRESALSVFKTLYENTNRELPAYFFNFHEFSLFGFGHNNIKKFNQALQLTAVFSTWPEVPVSDNLKTFCMQACQHHVNKICLIDSFIIEDDTLHSLLIPNYTTIDVIKALMPHTTQIGYPKHPAIDEIASLEAEARFVHSGLIGMFNGYHDFIGQFTQTTFVVNEETLTFAMPSFIDKDASLLTLRKALDERLKIFNGILYVSPDR